MLKIVFDVGSGEDLEYDARRLHNEFLKKNNLPRVSGVERALIPDYCYSCGEKAWAPVKGYAMCAKCRGEGKVPVGFRL